MKKITFGKEDKNDVFKRVRINWNIEMNIFYLLLL
jgi:hypothetical protein